MVVFVPDRLAGMHEDRSVQYEVAPVIDQREAVGLLAQHGSLLLAVLMLNIIGQPTGELRGRRGVHHHTDQTLALFRAHRRQQAADGLAAAAGLDWCGCEVCGTPARRSCSSPGHAMPCPGVMKVLGHSQIGLARNTYDLR
ncbi:hypothetical protein [Micromonospora sp. NPDC005237]|uniref:hypothetical protein n=1 Tax=Micromonospora sp. NPDC005237 TaxID=3155113 RepID=UPI0033B58B8C